MTTRILLRIGIGVLALGAAAAAQGKKEQPTLGAVAKAAQEEKAKAGAADSKADSTTGAKADVAAKAADENNAKATAGKKYTERGPRRPAATLVTVGEPHRSQGRGDGELRERQPGRGVTGGRGQNRSVSGCSTSMDRLNSAKAQLERARTEGGLYVPPSTNGRNPPVQVERQRLATRVQDLEAEVRRDQQAITELEEDARRAGALPGWLR